MSDPIRMTPKAILDEILRLAPEEQIEIIDCVRENLMQTDTAVPKWQLDEIHDRIQDPAEQATVSWADLKARLLRERIG